MVEGLFQEASGVYHQGRSQKDKEKEKEKGKEVALLSSAHAQICPARQRPTFCNVASTDNLGSSPLILANQNGHPAAFQALFEEGANVNYSRLDGASSLMVVSSLWRRSAKRSRIRRTSYRTRKLTTSRRTRGTICFVCLIVSKTQPKNLCFVREGYPQETAAYSRGRIFIFFRKPLEFRRACECGPSRRTQRSLCTYLRSATTDFSVHDLRI